MFGLHTSKARCCSCATNQRRARTSKLTPRTPLTSGFGVCCATTMLLRSSHPFPRHCSAYGEGSKGVYDGFVTNVHITDQHLDGPSPREMCLFKHLREFDLDGGNQAGPFPEWLADPSCVPGVQEIDLSYNRVSPSGNYNLRVALGSSPPFQ